MLENHQHTVFARLLNNLHIVRLGIFKMKNSFIWINNTIAPTIVLHYKIAGQFLVFKSNGATQNMYTTNTLGCLLLFIVRLGIIQNEKQFYMNKLFNCPYWRTRRFFVCAVLHFKIAGQFLVIKSNGGTQNMHTTKYFCIEQWFKCVGIDK